MINPITNINQQNQQNPVHIVDNFNTGSIPGTNLDWSTLIGNLFNTIFTILGIAAFAAVIYAGLKLLTAGGDESKATSARQALIATVIGMLIIVSSYLIIRLIAEAFD